MNALSRLPVIALIALIASQPLLHGQQADADGWVRLLDRDFTGWSFHLTEEGKDNEGTYAIEDGVMICRGRPSGYIYSDRSYSRFTIELEWMFDRPANLEEDAKFRGNSGLLIHVGETNALGVWPRSIEVQGKYTQAGLILPIPRKVKCRRTFDKAALRKLIRPVGEWHAMRVEVDAGDMKIFINDALVSTVSDCELTEGPIAFQSEGAATRWRNIRIREQP